MKAVWKKILSLLLCLVMLVGMFPAALAESPEQSPVTTQTVESTVQGSNSVGKMISNTLEGAEEESEDSPYSVTDIAVEGTLATVEYMTDRDAELLVAVYEEESGKMLGSGHGAAAAGSSKAEVGIEIESMPAYFVVSAYLLDPEDHSPLCEAFVSRYYTRDFQAFLATTVEDYDQDRVLNLDEDESTNFLVFGEDTILLEETAGVNELTDNGDGSYTILHADARMKALQPGDSFAYTWQDGSVLVVLVQSVSVDGDTVTVTENAEAELEDIFANVKIDGDSDGADLDVDTSEMDDDLVYLGENLDDFSPIDYARMNGLLSRENEINGRTALLRDIGGEFTYKNSLSLSIDKENADGKIKGAVKFSFKCKVEVYVSRDWKYVKSENKWKLELEGSVSGKFLEKRIPLPKVGFSPIAGLYIELSFGIVFEFEMEANLSVEVSIASGFIYDSDTGRTPINSSPKVKAEFKVEGTLFAGLEGDISVAAIAKKILSFTLKVKGGFEAVGTLLDTEFEPDDDVKHECFMCVDGSISAKLSVGLKFELLFGAVDFDVKLVELGYKLTDFYYSQDCLEFGFGKCPYKSYKVTASVLDEQEEPMKDVKILGTGLNTDPKTDEEGTAVFYLENGTYDLRFVGQDLDLNKNITVHDGKKNLVINKGQDSSSPGQHCGTYLNWFLDKDGTLTISGTGEMENYQHSGTTLPPWDGDKGDIKSLVVFKGVTGLGENAFFNCTALKRVSFPVTLTEIGKDAFSGCQNITDVYYAGTEDDWNSIAVASGNEALLQAAIHFNTGGLVEALQVGDYLVYGSYGGDPLVWQILAIEGEKVLLNLVSVTICFSYDTTFHAKTVSKSLTLYYTYGSATWEYSEIRQFLNNAGTIANFRDITFAYDDNGGIASFDWGDPDSVPYTGPGFLAEKNFSGKERGLLLPTLHSVLIPETQSGQQGLRVDLAAEISEFASQYDSAPQDTVMDYVFLLSGKEFKRYLVDQGLNAFQAPDGWTYNNCWLRDSVEASYAGYYLYCGNHCLAVNSDVGRFESDQADAINGVRPACWIDFSLVGKLSGTGDYADPFVMDNLSQGEGFRELEFEDPTEEGDELPPDQIIPVHPEEEAPAEDPDVPEEVPASAEPDQEAEGEAAGSIRLVSEPEEPKGTITWISGEIPPAVFQPAPVWENAAPARSVSPAQPDRIIPGEDGERDGLQTASFRGLVPGEPYLFLVTRDGEREDLLEAENLLFVDQGIADNYGLLSFSYLPRVSVPGAAVLVCGLPRSCRLSFDCGGGDAIAAKTVKSMEEVTLPTPYWREHTFLGWALEKGGEAVYQGGESITLRDDLTLYALWHNSYCTVTFDTDGGDARSPMTGEWHKAITLPKATRDGYLFRGWALEKGGEAAYQAGDSLVLEEDITLYAVWLEKLETNLTAYVAGTDSTYASLYVPLNEAVTLAVDAHVDLGGIHYAWSCEGEKDLVLPEDDQTASVTIPKVDGHYVVSCTVTDDYERSRQVTFYVYVDSGLEAYVAGTKDRSLSIENAVYQEPLTLSVDASVKVGSVHYQWNCSSGDSSVLPMETDGPDFTIPSVDQYFSISCYVTDDYGSTKYLYFYVRPYSGFRAVIAGTEETEQTVPVTPGGSCTLTVDAHADLGEVYYEWYCYTYGGPTMPDDTASASVTLQNINNNCWVYCSVRDDFNREITIKFWLKQDSGLTAYAAGTQESYVHLTEAPGERVTIGVDAHVDLGSLHYKWYCYSGDSSVLPQDEDHASFIIPELDQHYYFSCRVSDDYGGSTYVNFSVDVENHLIAHVVGTESNSERYTVEMGERITLGVEAHADTGPLAYKWSCSKGDASVLPQDEETASFTIPSVDQYYSITCEVSDIYGSSKYVYLYVSVENNLTAYVSGTIYTSQYFFEFCGPQTLAVEAHATQEGFTYQWRKTSEEDLYYYAFLNGATEAELAIEAVTAPCNYSCEVTDLYGNSKYVYFRFRPGLATALPLNQETAVSSYAPCGELYVSFTPERTGTYTLKTADGDPTAYAKLLGEQEDEYYYSFPYAAELEAGKTYYYLIEAWPEKDFTLHLTMKSESFATWEELQEQLNNSAWGDSFSYVGDEDPVILSSDLIIPAGVTVKFPARELVVAEGARVIVEEAARLQCRYLTVEGSIQNSGEILCRTVSGREKITHIGDEAATIQQCTPETENQWKTFLQEAAADTDPHFRYQVFIKQDLTVTGALSISPNVETHLTGGTLTIASGASLEIRGQRRQWGFVTDGFFLIYNGGKLLIRGTLINNGEIDFYDTDSLTLESGGTYSGSGEIWFQNDLGTAEELLPWLSLPEYSGYIVRNFDEDWIMVVRAEDYISGDLNRDGTVNSQDLVCMRKLLLDLDDTVAYENGDVNGDHTVDILDLVRLAKYLAGENVSLG